MAEDTENENTEENEARPANKPKKNIIFVILLAIVLIGISVGGTLLALKILGPQPVPEETEEALPEEVENPLPAQAIYYPVKPEIIVTYDVRGRRRYMQAHVNLMTREPDVIAALETHMPMIRNALNMILAGQVYSEIQTAEGKELMRLACLAELQRLLEQEIGKPGIEQVLFTNLVMQ